MLPINFAMSIRVVLSSFWLHFIKKFKTMCSICFFTSCSYLRRQCASDSILWFCYCRHDSEEEWPHSDRRQCGVATCSGPAACLLHQQGSRRGTSGGSIHWLAPDGGQQGHLHYSNLSRTHRHGDVPQCLHSIPLPHPHMECRQSCSR